MRSQFVLASLAGIALAVLAGQFVEHAGSASAQEASAPRVILVTLDGARAEELFGGLDVAVLRSTLGANEAVDAQPVYRRFWAPTPEERRAKLLPFFWNVLMRSHGSVAGNRALGSRVQLANQRRFSYPGYAEMVLGRPLDAEITSNDLMPAPRETALEFARRQLGLTREQVALFASWDVFNGIGERVPGGLTINAGYETLTAPRGSAAAALSTAQFETPSPWNSVRHDYYTFRLAMDHLARHRPRLLYLALGETDDWAHDGRYDRVLETYARTDAWLAELWQWLQSQPDYAGRTHLLISTDHGRGHLPADWKDHGESVEGAQVTWMAFVSPLMPRRGEWRDHVPLRNAQVAATLLAWLGLEPRDFAPEAAPAVR